MALLRRTTGQGLFKQSRQALAQSGHIDAREHTAIR